ncbi:serine/threonine-protein kinase [Streptomyces luteoverticillatus]|uniref:Serine/threonine-protein kinase n=1 Tax=Streptomyces luteoverticillatus TaxID=66425 RepID=A0A3Q9FV29_STRLT|nr:serine/threonine-protein kinase [Streptomyces luteoverticillatus]AZQ71347.1 serine/threonine-protein kinase [Streptomyces luteoverticillatus]
MGAFETLEPEDPRQVGRYRIVARLGSGGMGQVYLARSPGRRLLAVKVVRPELARDDEFRRRFAREVAAAKRVNGAFTAVVVDADPDGSPAWLATVYVPGVPLNEAVAAHGPWAARSVLALGAGLAEALEAIHAAGVVHRDLKPSNVLLAADGPRVIDFGISAAADASVLTRTGSVIGTPGFMSPEQLVGQPIGPASDVFALGSVLAYVATGVGPFGRGAPHALHYRAVHEQPDLAPLPPEVRDIVAACLAKQPHRRPALAALLDWLTTMDGSNEAPTLRLSEPGWMPDSIARLVREHTSAPLLHTPPPALPGTPPETPRPVPGTPASVRPSAASQPPAEPPGPTVAPEPKAHPAPAPAGEQHEPVPRPSVGETHSAEQRTDPATPSPGHPSGRRPRLSRRLVLLGLSGTALTAATVLIAWETRDSGTPSTDPAPEPGGKSSPDGAPGTRRWSFATGSGVDSSPSVAEGIVYVGSNDGKLYAVDAGTGRQRWAFPTDDHVGSSPTVANGVVYVGSQDTKVYAVDAITGRQRWAFPTTASVYSSPVVADGIVYVGSGVKLYAIEADTGKQRWASSLDGLAASTPMVVGGIVYAGTSFQLCAVDADTGKQRWAFPTSGGASSSAAVAGGVVYVAGWEGKLYAVEADTGKQRWTFSTSGRVYSSPTVADGVVYVGGMDHKLYAVGADTGKPRWTLSAGSEVSSSPTVADGVVYVGSTGGKLYAVKADTGELRWAFSAGAALISSPVVAHGVVYVGSRDKKLYAVYA